MKKTYQGTPDKSKQKFEVLGKRELLVEMPLPMIEVWEELQAQVEQLTGAAGLRIIGTILENEVTRRVGPPGALHTDGRGKALAVELAWVISRERFRAPALPRFRQVFPQAVH